MAASLQALRSAHQDYGDAPSSFDSNSRIRLLTGGMMPVLGLGTWQLKHQTVDTVSRALEAGFRMIDTAGDYHTQRGIGDALRQCGIPRDELYVVT
jgi:diketogulonate reductase-like aldo/keto reductase